MNPYYKSFFKFLAVSILITISSQLKAQEVKTRTLTQHIKVDALLYNNNGTIFASSGWNGSNIYKIAPNGQVSTHASGLLGIVDMVWGENDTIIGASYQDGKILKITPRGTAIPFAQYQGYGVATLFKDNNGDILCTVNPGLVSPIPGKIIKISPKGEVSTFASGGTINKPSGIAKDEYGNYYISNLGDGRITKISSDGSSELFATVPATGTWKIGYLKYWKGALYSTAISQNKIFKITRDGNVSLFSGTGQTSSNDGSVASASYNQPNGMTQKGDTLFVMSLASTNKLRYIVNKVTGVDEEIGQINNVFDLQNNYPNPFNPSTNIEYHLKDFTNVNLTVFNSLGENIRTIIDQNQNPGKYTVAWDGRDDKGNFLTSGMYIYQLSAGDYKESRKMVLLK